MGWRASGTTVRLSEKANEAAAVAVTLWPVILWIEGRADQIALG